MKRYSILSAASLLSLVACSPLVTKENSASFPSWELCTLLYNPESIYSDWISMEDENEVIRRELSRRGIATLEDCSIRSLARSSCDSYGFKPDSTEYSQCLLDVESHIEQMKQMKKAAHDAELASDAAQASQIANSMKLEQIKQEQQRQAWELRRQQMNQMSW